MKAAPIFLILAVFLSGCGSEDSKKEGGDKLLAATCLDKIDYSSESPPKGFWLGKTYYYKNKLTVLSGLAEAETISYSKKNKKDCSLEEKKEKKPLLSIQTEKLEGAYMTNPFSVIQECLNSLEFNKKSCREDMQVSIGKTFKIVFQTRLQEQAYRVSVTGKPAGNFCASTKQLVADLRLDSKNISSDAQKEFVLGCKELYV